MIRVPGLSDAVNSDQPVMHVTRVDNPPASRGPETPVLNDVLVAPDGRNEVL
jgi:hypothetical protein